MEPSRTKLKTNYMRAEPETNSNFLCLQRTRIEPNP